MRRSFPTWFGAILVVLLCAQTAVVAAGTGRVALAPGDPAPQVNGVTYPERQYFNSDWTAARFSLVNFFATWCVPCQREMPHLQKLHERFGPETLRIVGVFEPWEVDKIPPFTEELGITYPIVKPRGDVDRLWGGIGTKPTSFLIDSNGKILRRYVGATDEQTKGLIADIEAVVDGRLMPAQIVPDLSEGAVTYEKDVLHVDREKPVPQPKED